MCVKFCVQASQRSSASTRTESARFRRASARLSRAVTAPAAPHWIKRGQRAATLARTKSFRPVIRPSASQRKAARSSNDKPGCKRRRKPATTGCTKGSPSRNCRITYGARAPDGARIATGCACSIENGKFHQPPQPMKNSSPCGASTTMK